MSMMMMTSLEMGSLSFNQQSNHGIMGDHHGHGHGHNSNLPYSGDISSSESDLMEDGSLSSGCSSPASPVLSPAKMENGALGDMSSLLQQLPIKRGLSKYFNGKSQSYSSLLYVTCLEDLAKAENPYNKRLKSCKSYMCFSEAQKSPPPNVVLKSTSSSTKLISKKSSSKRNGGSSSFIGNNNGGMNMKPPTHPTPLRSSSTSSFNSRTPLFA